MRSGGGITEIYLVRHGETDWNRARRLQGTIDTPLNSSGVVQAHQLADRFGAVGLSAVVTSPLARARRTACAIARGRRSAFVVDPLVAEIDHGSWAGLTIPQIARQSPGAVVDEHVPSEALDGSGGETLAAAYRRASTALGRLVAAAPAHPVVVVSHGVINALLICAAVGHVPIDIDEYPQPNGCMYLLRFRRRALVALDCQPLERFQVARRAQGFGIRDSLSLNPQSLRDTETKNTLTGPTPDADPRSSVPRRVTR